MNTLNTIGTILGIAVSLMVIIPALVKVFIKPLLREHTETIMAKLDEYIKKNDRRWINHLGSGTHLPPSDRRFDAKPR